MVKTKFKILSGRKAAVGKAMDLILLVLFSVMGFFLVNMFFLNTANQSDESFFLNEPITRANSQEVVFLESPITLPSGVEVPLYQLLIAHSRQEDYYSEIEAFFNERYGIASWKVMLCGSASCYRPEYIIGIGGGNPIDLGKDLFEFKDNDGEIIYIQLVYSIY